MLSGASRTYTWNVDNLPASITQGGSMVTFAYDASGQRIQKTQGANSTLYFGLSEQVNGAMVQYYYAGPILVAKKQAGAQTWYHSDRLGSIRLMTNAAAVEVKDYDYQAFGSTQSQSGTEYNERGFNGHISDAETGLIYMGARYYDAQLGRFLSADTIIANLANPQSLNRYSYVNNNPINNTDPTGHKTCDGPNGECNGTGPGRGPGRSDPGSTTAGATSADDTAGDNGGTDSGPESNGGSHSKHPTVLIPGWGSVFTYQGYPILFGQARVGPTWSDTKFLDSILRGANWLKLADAIKNGEAGSEILKAVESLRITVSWAKNGEGWISWDTRTWSFLVKSGLGIQSNNVTVNNNPPGTISGRWNEISRLGDELPSTRIAVTDGRNGPILDTVEIPSASGEDPVIEHPINDVPEILRPMLGLPGTGAGVIDDGVTDVPDVPIDIIDLLP